MASRSGAPASQPPAWSVTLNAARSKPSMQRGSMTRPTVMSAAEVAARRWGVGFGPHAPACAHPTGPALPRRAVCPAFQFMQRDEQAVRHGTGRCGGAGAVQRCNDRFEGVAHGRVEPQRGLQAEGREGWCVLLAQALAAAPLPVRARRPAAGRGAIPPGANHAHRAAASDSINENCVPGGCRGRGFRGRARRRYFARLAHQPQRPTATAAHRPRQTGWPARPA